MPKVEPEKSSLKSQIKDTAMVSLCYKLNPYFPHIVKFLLYPNDIQLFLKLKIVIGNWKDSWYLFGFPIIIEIDFLNTLTDIFGYDYASGLCRFDCDF